MLKITLHPVEKYDKDKREFYTDYKEQVIFLEHSLLSISKWESRHCKPFLSMDKDNTTAEELLDYIRCMTVTPNVDEDRFNYLTADELKIINDYINEPMTATTITDNRNVPKKKEIVTSELIYYWMVAYNIPFECQKWPIKRLLMLIKICDIKNNPGKKMSRKEIMAKQRQLNESRRAMMNSKG